MLTTFHRNSKNGNTDIIFDFDLNDFKFKSSNEDIKVLRGLIGTDSDVDNNMIVLRDLSYASECIYDIVECLLFKIGNIKFSIRTIICVKNRYSNEGDSVAALVVNTLGDELKCYIPLHHAARMLEECKQVNTVFPKRCYVVKNQRTKNESIRISVTDYSGVGFSNFQSFKNGKLK